MQIYTDGGCTGNPGPGGWAAVILDKAGKAHEISGADPKTTNNRMELTAVIRALEHVNTASGPIEVITDSEYVQKGISIWMANWIRKGWKTAAGKPVKNQDLWKQLQEMSTLRPIRWTWVKGHAGNHWNERCDALVEEQRKNMNEKDNLAAILAIFNEINTIPRKSTQLEKIRPWLLKWGKDRGFEVKTDNAGNIVYKVPATPGYESAPTIVLQGHMDMVCEKRSGSDHNFQTDPIISWTDGDWLKARETSLGADNGIALAMFFHIVTAPDSEHPPLEVLITSDEETGLVGAQNLDPGILSGKILLNLDSEDEGVFTIGCAGGMDVNMVLPVEYSPVPGGYLAMEINIGGLEGGHSGIEIHLGKACANTLLGRVLRTVLDVIPEARIGEISGGTAHNALPREAKALIALHKDRVPELEKLIARLDADLKQENAALEKRSLSFHKSRRSSPSRTVHGGNRNGHTGCHTAYSPRCKIHVYRAGCYGGYQFELCHPPHRGNTGKDFDQHPQCQQKSGKRLCQYYVWPGQTLWRYLYNGQSLSRLGTQYSFPPAGTLQTYLAENLR